ncbi:hypothetical protein Clacol_001429 [Clathrus columnatus]|uniref:Autophagy-related protein 29 n=1 Tax=Clathrus columnatus TaxID=1419009 RepID=A0AAV4ZY90_9AGAM|nr:hypothetical protein Clacol_001429 [Clathrus columnatus]
MPSVPAKPPVHIIVRLPYNRSEFPINDPPVVRSSIFFFGISQLRFVYEVQWNAVKENMLWEVIARSRATNSGGTDWPALSAHLQVPLPYLLYRAQVRYEEDLRTLQDVRTTLTGSNSLATANRTTETERPNSSLPVRNLTGGVTSSLRRYTPINGRIRTPSHKLTHQETIPSMIVQPTQNTPNRIATPESSGSDEEEMDAMEEETRKLEEEEAVGRRLKELEKMINSDTLGFVRAPKPPSRINLGSSQDQTRSQLAESVRREDSVAGTSESSVASPQGSIPSIPSTPTESRSPTGSSALSSVQATTTLPQNHQPQSPSQAQSSRHNSRRGFPRSTQHANSQGSAASSFSDLSDAPSISASALESALMSNIRGGGSRL